MLNNENTTDVERLALCNAAVEEDLAWVEEMEGLRECHAVCNSTTRANLLGSTTLDSSMKKNAAAIRKMKTLHEGNADQVTKEISMVNQSKYISEVVSAILEAPLKIKDVKSVVRISSMLFQRYEDFDVIMSEKLTQMLVAPGTNIRTKRLYIRLFFSYIKIGIFHRVSTSVFTIVRSWTEVKVSMSSGDSIDMMSLINAFLKAGRQGLFQPIYVYPHESTVVKLTSQNNSEAAACQVKIELCNAKHLELWALSESEQVKMKARLHTYLESALESLENAWKRVVETKRHNDSVINTRGDLSQKKVEQYQTLCDQFEAFEKAVNALASTMSKTLPKFSIPNEFTEDESFARVVDTSDQITEMIFDDPDDKALYTELPLLSELLPSVLLGKKDSKSDIADVSNDLNEELPELEDETEAQDLLVEDINDMGGDSSISVRELLSKLPECVSIETCDSFVIEYCYAGGAKLSSQKSLAAALSRPPFGAIQLLPYYSRIIASVAPWFPLIKDYVISYLQREFYGLKKKVDISTGTVEPRLRNASYIAELVKFGVYPPGKAFLQLRSLFDDFSRHNIDTSCCIVQNCGRYLLKRPDTSERMVNMMNIMIKLKNAKNLEDRQNELILACQASMYATDTSIAKKARSKSSEYIRHLIYIELNKNNVSSVSSRLRRISWTAESQYVQKKIMSAVRKGKHDQLSNLALLIENIGRYYPSFAVDIIDEVMEEIFCGLEHPDTKYNQRRLSMVRFLAVLCQQKIAPNNLLEDTMRCLLSYSIDDHIQDAFFRIKLITTLSIASNDIFVRSKMIKSRIIRFLVYFEEFVLLHQPLPLDLRIDIEEMYSTLKVKRTQFTNHEEALEAIEKAQSLEKSWKNRDALQSIPESGTEDEDTDTDMQSETVSDDLENDDESNESDTGSDKTWSTDDDVHMRGTERTAEEESFERELALAMGTSNQADTSRSITHKHAQDATVEEDTLKVSFRVMTKKGGRDDRSKSVHIPVSSGVANRLEQNKEAAAAEKAALKRMVLASEF